MPRKKRQQRGHRQSSLADQTITRNSFRWLNEAEVHFRRAFELDETDNAPALNLAVLLAIRTPSRTGEARELVRVWPLETTQPKRPCARIYRRL